MTLLHVARLSSFWATSILDFPEKLQIIVEASRLRIRFACLINHGWVRSSVLNLCSEGTKKEGTMWEPALEESLKERI